ncbi:MAG: MFS transporter [Planctomycetales bacterium]|nr:MFS transporter [Planctomycetales bacterium]
MFRPLQTTPAAPSVAPRHSDVVLQPYGRSFWATYAGNVALMVAVSLLFRFADFVKLVGGGELLLGWVVGIGTVGSLTMRLAQGTMIDRCGARFAWAVSLVAVIVALLAHLWISADAVPALFAVRILYQCGIAGAFGASITFISLRAPADRMAEMIGMLGSSGFVGMALGSQLGDWICHESPVTRAAIDQLFVAAAGLAAFSLLACLVATYRVPRRAASRRVPALLLLRRYHPGRMLLMGTAMGIGLGLPGTFVRPFTESIDVTRIGTFFGVYAVSAFLFRMAMRRVPDRIGAARASLLGMAAVVLGLLSFLSVQTAPGLVLPALLNGLGHALLFPSAMAGGSRSFPTRYRGLGVTIMLGSFDLGNLIGMPLAGTILYAAEQAAWPPFPTMFICTASLLAAVCLIFVRLPANTVRT